MKKVYYLFGILSIFLITGLAFTTFNAKAHNPMHLDFKYDRDDSDTADNIVDQTIYITVIHGVTDPEFHYVYNITIFVNNTFLKTELYTSQPTTNIFTYAVTGIIVGIYANVSVTAWCSIDGSYTKKFVVGVWLPEHKGSFLSILPPTIISTILVAVVVMIPGVRQKLKKRK